MRYFDDRSPFSKVVSMLFGLSLSVSSFADTAIPPKPLSDPALEAFLQKQIETEEGVQIQSVVKAELEPNLLGEERVVIWTLLGPAYWSNHLSVLSQPNGQWQLLATLSLRWCRSHTGGGNLRGFNFNHCQDPRARRPGVLPQPTTNFTVPLCQRAIGGVKNREQNRKAMNPVCLNRLTVDKQWLRLNCRVTGWVLLLMTCAALAAGTYADFLQSLARRESAGNSHAVNKYGYAGLYQMGEEALIDAGYYRRDGTKSNDWRGNWTGKNGVNSLNDYPEQPCHPNPSHHHLP